MGSCFSSEARGPSCSTSPGKGLPTPDISCRLLGPAAALDTTAEMFMPPQPNDQLEGKPDRARRAETKGLASFERDRSNFHSKYNALREAGDSTVSTMDHTTPRRLGATAGEPQRPRSTTGLPFQEAVRINSANRSHTAFASASAFLLASLSQDNPHAPAALGQGAHETGSLESHTSLKSLFSLDTQHFKWLPDQMITTQYEVAVDGDVDDDSLRVVMASVTDAHGSGTSTRPFSGSVAVGGQQARLMRGTSRNLSRLNSSTTGGGTYRAPTNSTSMLAASRRASVDMHFAPAAMRAEAAGCSGQRPVPVEFTGHGGSTEFSGFVDVTGSVGSYPTAGRRHCAAAANTQAPLVNGRTAPGASLRTQPWGSASAAAGPERLLATMDAPAGARALQRANSNMLQAAGASGNAHATCSSAVMNRRNDPRLLSGSHAHVKARPASAASHRHVQLGGNGGGCGNDSLVLTLSSSLPDHMSRGAWKECQFKRVRLLHAGYASHVYEARCLISNTKVAMKVYRLAGRCELERLHLYREITLHSKICHQNIVQFYAAFKELDSIYIILEYVEGGTLRDAMRAVGAVMPEKMAAQEVLHQTMLALQYLHGRGILHRDIKPENILVSHTGRVKLADMGLAINVWQEPANTRAGTLVYMTPEVLMCGTKRKPSDYDKEPIMRSDPRGALHTRLARASAPTPTYAISSLTGSPAAAAGTHDNKANDVFQVPLPAMPAQPPPMEMESADVVVHAEQQDDDPMHAEDSTREWHYGLGADTWAIGVLAYELVVGRTPFASRTDEGVVLRIAQGVDALRLPRYLSPHAKNFIRLTLDLDFRHRPPITLLLNHPWCSGQM